MTILAEVIRNESYSIQFKIFKLNYYKVNRFEPNRLQTNQHPWKLPLYFHIKEENNRFEYDHQNESNTI